MISCVLFNQSYMLSFRSVVTFIETVVYHGYFFDQLRLIFDQLLVSFNQLYMLLFRSVVFDIRSVLCFIQSVLLYM